MSETFRTCVTASSFIRLLHELATHVFCRELFYLTAASSNSGLFACVTKINSAIGTLPRCVLQKLSVLQGSRAVTLRINCSSASFCVIH